MADTDTFPCNLEVYAGIFFHICSNDFHFIEHTLDLQRPFTEPWNSATCNEKLPRLHPVATAMLGGAKTRVPSLFDKPVEETWMWNKKLKVTKFTT